MKPPFSEADKVLQQSKTVRITWTWSLASIGNTSAISHNHKRIDPFRGKVGKVWICKTAQTTAYQKNTLNHTNTETTTTSQGLPAKTAKDAAGKN